MNYPTSIRWPSKKIEVNSVAFEIFVPHSVDVGRDGGVGGGLKADDSNGVAGSWPMAMAVPTFPSLKENLFHPPPPPPNRTHTTVNDFN